LTEGREGKNQDQKEKDPSDGPNVLTPVSHKGYLKFENRILKLSFRN
jgi:hypothetical protein